VSTTTLPRLVLSLGVDDNGPSDNGRASASCPHCGAPGRYIHRALAEDGSIVAAMSGCIKLFPKSKAFDATARTLERVKERTDKGWKQTSWDLAILDTIGDFRNGQIEFDVYEAMVLHQARSRAAYYQNKRRNR